MEMQMSRKRERRGRRRRDEGNELESGRKGKER